MSTPQHELVRRGVAAYNALDTERMLELAHPELVWKPLSATEVDGTTYEGHEGIVRYFEDLRAIWEVMHVEIEELRGDADRVVLLGRIRARGRGSRADVETPTAMLIEVRDGLLIRCETRRDLDDLPG